MALSNAERQAAYRARRREVAAEQPDPLVARLSARILALEEEIRQPQDRAGKPKRAKSAPQSSSSFGQFRPAPKIPPNRSR